jgi:hypothetical protein
MIRETMESNPQSPASNLIERRSNEPGLPLTEGVS